MAQLTELYLNENQIGDAGIAFVGRCFGFGNILKDNRSHFGTFPLPSSSIVLHSAAFSAARTERKDGRECRCGQGRVGHFHGCC